MCPIIGNTYFNILANPNLLIQCYSDAVVNPLQTISTDDLIGKLSPSLDRKLIAVFMQDEVVYS